MTMKRFYYKKSTNLYPFIYCQNLSVCKVKDNSDGLIRKVQVDTYTNTDPVTAKSRDEERRIPKAKKR